VALGGAGEDGEEKPVKKVENSIKPKKVKGPAPGSYNVEECFPKTHWPKNNQFLFTKTKNNTYVD
jgi:hypothetical protein